MELWIWTAYNSHRGLLTLRIELFWVRDGATVQSIDFENAHGKVNFCNLSLCCHIHGNMKNCFHPASYMHVIHRHKSLNLSLPSHEYPIHNLIKNQTHIGDVAMQLLELSVLFKKSLQLVSHLS